jgi:hypothetical protein
VNFYWPFFGQFSFSTLAEVVDGRIAQFPNSRSCGLQAESGLLADWLVNHDCLWPASVDLPLP